MSITVGTKDNVFLLSTQNTSYAFGIDDRGLVRHLYWGKKIPSAEELEMPVLTEVSTGTAATMWSRGKAGRSWSFT